MALFRFLSNFSPSLSIIWLESSAAELSILPSLSLSIIWLESSAAELSILPSPTLSIIWLESPAAELSILPSPTLTYSLISLIPVKRRHKELNYTKFYLLITFHWKVQMLLHHSLGAQWDPLFLKLLFFPS